ncbi:sensor domain-containing diguanylate cyclase [Porticoccus sp.]|uniref:sensor domain-containing diguanylate cyclase n=1 Tax=Porticoccus sp. TaxID=2024853 RepID=UPI0025F377DA|nr:sensor domain-containing diguanylate cyclase [Porticoccus sp.]
MVQQQKFAVSLMEHLVTATFVLDRDGYVVIWNKSCERLTGVRAEEVLGTRDHWKAFYAKQRLCLADVLVQERTAELDQLYAVHAQLSIYGEGYKAENWCVMPRIGSRLYLTVDAGPIYDAHGSLIAVVQTIRDNTDYKNAQSKLEKMAITDELTGLYNRRYFTDHLDMEWRRGMRSREPLALIFLDIDYFKQYNDHYGHMVGDDCLKSIATTIQHSLLRATDMATRYGGEEFCILLPNTSLTGALKVAAQVQANIKRLQIPHADNPISSSITISAGVASLVPTTEERSSRLTSLADKALYEAKGRGRDQTVASDTC